MMQHKPGQIEGEIIRISDQALARCDKAISMQRIRISHLSMAAKATVARISDDYPQLKPYWFCLQVMTGREEAVEKSLVDEGVETLVVRSNPYETVRRGRKRMIPARPVLRGYVLVRCLALPAAIMGLLSVDHVLSIVGGPVTPYRASDESILRFKQMADEGKYDHKDPAKVVYLVGQQVRVVDGPFASFPAAVIACDAEKGRVDVEVNIFGRATPVNLDIAQIEKL